MQVYNLHFWYTGHTITRKPRPNDGVHASTVASLTNRGLVVYGWRKYTHIRDNMAQTRGEQIPGRSETGGVLVGRSHS